MGYALSNLVDGQPPSARAVASANDLASGEVWVDDVPPNTVWDASAHALRQRSGAEVLTQAKAAKKGQLQAALASELNASLGNPWLVMARLRANPNDTGLAPLTQARTKYDQLASQADAATSLADVQAVSW